MNGNDNLVWILLGLGVVFFFWRAIWGLAVLGGVLAVLVYVWANPGYSDSAKLIASGIAIAVGSLLFPKKVSLPSTRRKHHSTVTLFARLRGLSTSVPLAHAV